MERINHAVINWYELELDKEEGVAYLRRYNRPATSCDHGELFVQKLLDEYGIEYQNMGPIPNPQNIYQPTNIPLLIINLSNIYI